MTTNKKGSELQVQLMEIEESNQESPYDLDISEQDKLLIG
jgi:hypothetical protein